MELSGGSLENACEAPGTKAWHTSAQMLAHQYDASHGAKGEQKESESPRENQSPGKNEIKIHDYRETERGAL